MTIRDMFVRLGFPKHADTVFTTLEKSGPQSISALSAKSRIHRPALYRALRALAEQKLIETKRFGKRAFYAAAPRARLLALFDTTAKEAAQLSAERPVETAMTAIRYFEGVNGITAVFNDVVEHAKRGDTFYRYTSERDLDNVNAHLPSDYRTRRDGKRLERLVISNPESGKRKRSRLERFIKFLGSGTESFNHNAIQLIYGSRIAFIDLNANRSFIIDNPTLADFQKTIFKALYRRLERIP